MATHEENIFQKTRKHKKRIQKCEESAHHGVSIVLRPSAIQHSKSVERHSQAPNGPQPYQRSFMQFCLFRYFFFLGQLN